MREQIKDKGEFRQNAVTRNESRVDGIMVNLSHRESEEISDNIAKES